MSAPRASDSFSLTRYESTGESDVRLRGRVEERQEEFVYAASFPAETDGRAFIPSLWASYQQRMPLVWKYLNS